MFRDLLRTATSSFITLSDEQLGQLEAHWLLLSLWNRRLNLTRIDMLAEAVERHYGESLFLASHLPGGPLRIADLGSGAGFPGFPIAVARPDCQVTLVESHQRKAVFLKEAARSLCNVRVAAKRAEDVQESFDHVVVRAVAWCDIGKTALGLAPVAWMLAGSDDELLVAEGWKLESAGALPSSRKRYLARVSRETCV